MHFRRFTAKKSAIRMPFYPYPTIVVVLLLLAFLFGMPRESLTIGNILILSLLILYYLFREFKKKKPVKIRIFE